MVYNRPSFSLEEVNYSNGLYSKVRHEEIERSIQQLAHGVRTVTRRF